MFPFVLLIFFCRGHYKNFTNPIAEWFYVAMFFAASFFLSAHCLKHLPIFDFMPYHVGQNIPEAMVIPEDAPRSEYRTILIYEKDGERQEFTDVDYPWQDTSWHFVDSKSVLVKQGYTPPVYNFSITHPDEGDITENILDNEYVFLLVAPKLEKSSVEQIERIKQLSSFAKNKGYAFVGLTASTQDATADFSAKHYLNFDFCSADETTLKSMVRAHPGVMLLHRGTVVGKWNARDIPSDEFFDKQLIAANINALQQSNSATLKWTYIFATLSAILLIVLISNASRKKARR
jgi:peroxiredoxin